MRWVVTPILNTLVSVIVSMKSLNFRYISSGFLNGRNRFSSLDFESTRATISKSIADDKTPPIKTHSPISMIDFSGNKIIVTRELNPRC